MRKGNKHDRAVQTKLKSLLSIIAADLKAYEERQKPSQDYITMSEKFTAYVYQEDLRKIQELVQLHPNIETGGDLFGLWQDERTVIIQRFIGPGKKCFRTTASFYQDVEYLRRVGSLITTEESLCNVGEWHSHHQTGMHEPSDGDRRTVFSNMPKLGLERFMLFIATIEKADFRGKRYQEVSLCEVQLRPFLFIGSTQKVLKGIKMKDCYLDITTNLLGLRLGL